MAAGVGLSHKHFDSAILSGGLPTRSYQGLVIAARRAFGHLMPAIFPTSGANTSGVSNDDRRSSRQKVCAGEATREELMAASEDGGLSRAGTCTFYGTANTTRC